MTRATGQRPMQLPRGQQLPGKESGRCSFYQSRDLVDVIEFGNNGLVLAVKLQRKAIAAYAFQVTVGREVGCRQQGSGQASLRHGHYERCGDKAFTVVRKVLRGFIWNGNGVAQHQYGGQLSTFVETPFAAKQEAVTDQGQK